MVHIRRLAAIMFTDIEGYTAIMQRSESEGIKTRQKHRDVFVPTTEKYQGKIVQYYGDGTLSIFNSAISAVRCACELQQLFRQAPSIPVRIGIHIGDIILTEEDIIGDAVNLASRLETLAVAGSVLFSSQVMEEISNQEDIAIKSLGSFHLKNDRSQREIFAIDHPELVVPQLHQLKGNMALEQKQTTIRSMHAAPDSKDRDVLISYAQVDDETLTVDDFGWISSFDQALKKRTAQLLGYQPGIWMETEQSIDEQQKEHFDQLKVMVAILSPRYLDSEICMSQLKEFYNIAEQKGGIKINSKWRIFKVIKTPIPYERHPPELESIFGYEFFEISEDGHFREFTLDKKSPNYYQFLERFEDVAQDLSHVIRRIDSGEKKDAKAQPSTAKAEAPAVYLTTTTSDISHLRDNVRRDLEMHGYRVLPAEQLPLDQRLRSVVEDNLSKCQLSVVLVGGKFGLVPEDEEHSVPVLQYQLCMEADVPCLIWKSPDLQILDPRQQRFVDTVETAAPNHEITEVLSDEFEDFKTHLMDTLEQIAPQEQPVFEEEVPPRVYLIYDKADSEAASVLDDYLYNLGFEVLTPLFDGNEDELREMHKDNLRVCDAAIIYYHYGSEFWLNAKINDLRKAAGYGRTRPISKKVVYVSGDKTPSKERFRSRELEVIKQFDAFSGESLNSFSTILKQSS